MKKALLVTTVSGFVPQFEMNSVSLLQDNGYEVHYATNYDCVFYGKDNSRLDGTNIIKHQIDFARSPYSKQTFVAYKQLNRLLSENQFDVIHCHTPMGGMLARIVGNKCKVKKIVYTAHGFHFYKGAPVINWVIYYFIEKALAKYTDALLTINKEDYFNAKKFKLKPNGDVFYIAGAGIDTAKYRDVKVCVNEKKKELGIEEDDFVLLSVGEINQNKNHETVINALHQIEHKKLKYIICGDGVCKNKLCALVEKLNLQDCVKFVGYRTDINEIEKVVDLFVFPSFREGLPVSMMEAMASGLPVLASKIRGNVDLITEDVNGYLLNPSDSVEWAQKIKDLYLKKDKLREMGEYNKEFIKSYDRKKVKEQLQEIYHKQGII